MGEVEEQRYVCRICSKRCVSGKSLGGHMRVHLAQIAASKKAAAEIKVECDDDNDQDGSYQLKESSAMNQSNSGNVSEGKINKQHCVESGDGDGDQSNSYELRENPKKSWRISDPKHGLIKKVNSCKECGKEFASLRALSGHMRCHSIKNKKEVHQCKECGRGFDSIRAMFGHMKSHSKRVKVSDNVESAESLSDLENFCPIRRKRSRIRYKGTVNPSFSGVDASNSAVSELEEAEEAAKCLVMLSRGVRSFLKFDSNAELSDDDSAYYGAVTSCRSKKSCENGDGDFATDADKKLNTELQLECFSSGYIEKNVSEFDELDVELIGGDQTKVDGDDDVLNVENEMNADLVCDDEILEPAVGNNEGDESCFEKKSCESEADLEMVEDSEKKPAEHKRRQRALGSQNGRDKMVGASSNLHTNGSLLSVSKGDSKHDQCNGEEQVEQEMETSKSKERECPICFKVFASGQALGGHKRAHYNGVVESKNQDMLDLNFPISGDAGTRGGLNSWFVERSREHEALLLTT